MNLPPRTSWGAMALLVLALAFAGCEGDDGEGKRHEYIRYTNGEWQREGGDRRDAQATLDGDVQQGDQTINSTIYEQRTTIMVNDPNAATDVTNFGEFGCFLSCHNESRHMPEWTSASGHDGKYIDPAQAPGTTSGKFAFKWENFWTTPFYYMVDDNAQQEGPRSPNPGIIAYADALAMGYAPQEGDTVPRRVITTYRFQ